MNTKLIILEHWTLEHWTWASWTLHITLFLTCKIWCAYLLTEENKLERGIPLLLQPDRKHLFQVNMISRHACVHFTHCTFITMFFTMFGTNYKVFQTLHCKPCCFFKCCVKELIEWKKGNICPRPTISAKLRRLYERQLFLDPCSYYSYAWLSWESSCFFVREFPFFCCIQKHTGHCFYELNFVFSGWDGRLLF